MIKTLGKQPTGTPPSGFFKAVHFPQLALLDQETGDGRLLESAGAGTRNLPLSIRAQFASTYGHEGALVTGTLFEVTIDPESGIMSGNGFLLDDENGRKHAKYIQLQAMRGNSVDLADCDIIIKWKSDDPEDPDFFEYTVVFTKFNLAATTGVGTPAFADARAELPDGMTDEELMASLGDPMEPLICEFDTFSYSVELPTPAISSEQADELMAAGIVQDWDTFFHPESPTRQKLTIFEDRTFCGHLGLWGERHEGMAGLVVIPRPTDNYASFNKPGVLTNRGIVETGPIFLWGGHRRIGGKTAEDAYGGAENAWGDCRVTPGVLGPWCSGVVRPGVSEEAVYAARASRISGHWLGDRLRAIVSVNTEAFDVPGSGDDPLARALMAGFGSYTNADGVPELVASLPRYEDEPPPTPLGLTIEDRDAIAEKVLASLGKGTVIFTTTSTTEVVETVIDEVVVNAGPAADDLILADLLADED